MAKIIKSLTGVQLTQQHIDTLIELAQTASLFALGFLCFAFLG